MSQPNCTLPDAVEGIEIGGVTLLRAAVKNHARIPVCRLNRLPRRIEPESWQQGRWRKHLQQTCVKGVRDERSATTRSVATRPSCANPHRNPAQAFVSHDELPFKSYEYPHISFQSFATVLCDSRERTNLLDALESHEATSGGALVCLPLPHSSTSPLLEQQSTRKLTRARKWFTVSMV